MKLLALDTAQAACSVCVIENDQIRARAFEEMARGHAAALIPMVDQVMREAALSFEELDGYGVTIGPGAFTGLRIALSSARAFGLAHQKPVIGVTTLETLAHQIQPEAAPDQTILCALDAKRADLYVQSFETNLHPRQDPIAALPDQVVDSLNLKGQTVLIGGDCYERVAPLFEQRACTLIQSKHRHLDAQSVAKIALRRLEKGDPVGAHPLYIRPPDAALPKNGGRLRP